MASATSFCAPWTALSWSRAPDPRLRRPRAAASCWRSPVGNDLVPGVRAAVAVTSEPGSVVMVVHVAQAIFAGQGSAFVESDEEINATIGEAIRLLDDAGVEAQGMVALAGPVAVAEVAQSWSADLIVTGSSRMRDLGSILLGSVSHDLLRATDRPVLIAERVGA
jgi:nucleotide-binding universal stress UspA family protein